MSALPAVAVLVGAAATFWWVARRRRQRRLAAISAAWGKPVARARDFAQLAADEPFVPALRQETTLDDRTWQDLNLDEVFAELDRTGSGVGQLALYARLRTSGDPEAIPAFDELVRLFGSASVPRQHIQLILARLGQGSTDVWRLTRPGTLAIRRIHALFPALAALAAGVVVLIPLWPPALMVLIGIALANLVVRAFVTRQLWPVLGPFRELGALLACARKLRRLVPVDNPLVRPLIEDVADLRRLERIARWASRGGGADTGNPASLVMEYLNLLFFLDANALYFGSRELARQTTALRRVIDAVGQVDAAVAVASWRAGTPGWTRPTFVPAGAPISIESMRHPLIPGCVPNTLRIAPPSGWLITGSNMSGKTTFLRTVGVTAVLAQSIFTCLAERYEAPWFVIRSCIGRADTLLEGRSYYLAEAESVLAIAAQVRGATSCLCLFDELFRGTNVVERLAAGEAVLRALVTGAHPGGSTIVLTATHDGELIELLDDLYTPMHFGDRIGADGLEFDFRLRPGPATSRNAIALLRQLGAAPELVERAERTARALDRRPSKT